MASHQRRNHRLRNSSPRAGTRPRKSSVNTTRLIPSQDRLFRDCDNPGTTLLNGHEHLYHYLMNEMLGYSAILPMKGHYSEHGDIDTSTDPERSLLCLQKRRRLQYWVLLAVSAAQQRRRWRVIVGRSGRCHGPVRLPVAKKSGSGSRAIPWTGPLLLPPQGHRRGRSCSEPARLSKLESAGFTDDREHDSGSQGERRTYLTPRDDLQLGPGRVPDLERGLAAASHDAQGHHPNCSRKAARNWRSGRSAIAEEISLDQNRGIAGSRKAWLNRASLSQVSATQNSRALATTGPTSPTPVKHSHVGWTAMLIWKRRTLPLRWLESYTVTANSLPRFKDHAHTRVYKGCLSTSTNARFLAT